MRRIAALAAVCAALLLAGCRGPSIEELAERGITAVEYTAGGLAMQVEQAVLAGESSFVVNYHGGLDELPALAEADWRQGYVNRRFVNSLRAEYEELDGFVRASYVLSLADMELLGTMPREGGGLRMRSLSLEEIVACIDEMLMEGAQRRVFIFESAVTIEDMDAMVYEGVRRAQEGHYACEYLTDQISWTVSGYGDVVELELKLTYASGTVPLNEMPAISGERALLDALVELWNHRVSASATALLEGMEISGEELLALLDVAESNCALAPCEADRLWYEQYPAQEGRQIIKVWLEVPMPWEELSSRAEELKAEVERRGALIASRHTEAEKQYRAVYREVISAAKYDDEMSKATTSETLTDGMRLGRSAYGALVEGYTVCSGYARAYKALCDYLGLECYVISGVHRGVNHAWNMVVLNGEKLYVDCSFADTGGGGRYCLFDEEMMRREGYQPAESFALMAGLME